MISIFHYFYTELNGNMSQKLTINLGGNIPFFCVVVRLDGIDFENLDIYHGRTCKV